MAWLSLIIAIVAEVIATSALKASNGFTQLWPSVVTVVGYCVSFYFLSLTMRHMPTGVIYAIWSGMGIVLISAVAWIFFKQRLDLPAIIGMSLAWLWPCPLVQLQYSLGLAMGPYHAPFFQEA